MSKFAINDLVQWKWGAGTAVGLIIDSYTSRVTTTIKGANITRNATEQNPAFLIEQENGNKVLKSQSELELA